MALHGYSDGGTANHRRTSRGYSPHGRFGSNGISGVGVTRGALRHRHRSEGGGDVLIALGKVSERRPGRRHPVQGGGDDRIAFSKPAFWVS